MFNDGKLDIYKKVFTKTEGLQLITQIEFYKAMFYSELNFSVEEYYNARQEGRHQQLKRIRIHQDKSISTDNIIIISGVQYEVGRTFSTDVKGIDITDITLEKVETDYDIIGI